MGKNAICFSTKRIWLQATDVALDGCKDGCTVGNDAAERTCLIISSAIRALDESFAFSDVVVQSVDVVDGVVSQNLFFPCGK